MTVEEGVEDGTGAWHYATGIRPTVRPWVPVLAFVLFCVGLGGTVGWYTEAGHRAGPASAPEHFFAGEDATVDVPYSMQDVALWAEFRFSDGEPGLHAPDTIGKDWTSAVRASGADGTPITFRWDDRLASYERDDGDGYVLGVPIGVARTAGTHVSLPELGAAGFALGPVKDVDRVDLTPATPLILALIAALTFTLTIRPRLSQAARDEEELLRQHDVARKDQSRRERDAARAAYLWDQRARYQAARAEYDRQQSYRDQRMYGHALGPRPPDQPDPYGWIMIVLVLAAPLFGFLGAIAWFVQTIGGTLIHDTVVGDLLPIGGDDAWRVTVMSATLALAAASPAVLTALLATSYRTRKLRRAAVAIALVVAVVVVLIAASSTTWPVTREV